LDQFAAAGVKLVVTCDVGISAVGEVAYGRTTHGQRFVITDHHRPPEVLPEAEALVDPLLPGSAYPFGGICGAGVSFKVLAALCRDMGLSAQDNLIDLLEFVGLATIADVVPLVDENRAMVAAGLKRMRRSAFPGLRALAEVGDLDLSQLEASQVAFRLAPPLNATGRIADPALGLSLLLEDDPEQARALAVEVHRCNNHRKAMTDHTIEEALEKLVQSGQLETHASLVVWGPGPEAPPEKRWHHGLVGIVAGKIKERTGRPTFVFTYVDGAWTGSGRAEAAEGFDLYTALMACGDHLAKGGGHAAAAGAKLSGQDPAPFAAAFEQAVRAQLGDRLLRPLLVIDMELDPEDVTHESVMALEGGAPYGAANQAPIVLLRNLTAVQFRRMGTDDRYLKATLAAAGLRLEAVVFDGADDVERLLREDGGRIHAVVQLERNEWRGEVRLQGRVLDACRAPMGDMPAVPPPAQRSRARHPF
jgi:single-stranded-DNA-specific exonuclease